MQPVVVAHRGASAHRAEHTLGAYELALKQGAEGLECDVRLTRDGHLVCVHDRRVDRTSSGRGVVSELTLERMTQLDFGRWHDDWPDSADHLVADPIAVPLDAPQRRSVLTLEALLSLVADTGTKLFVETKHPVRYGGLVEAKLVAMLARFGLATPRAKADSAVVMMSFSSLAVRRFRQQAPKLPTVLLARTLTAMRRDGTLPPWADLTGPSIRLLREDPDYVARATASGHDTYTWTVDEPVDVELCRKLGVTYMATNTPKKVRTVLEAP